jgi:hypothetical protein
MFSSKIFFRAKQNNSGGFYCLGGPECQADCQYIANRDDFVSPCTINGPFATEELCLASCSANSSSSSSNGGCWDALASGTRGGNVKFYNTLPAPQGSNPTATATASISRLGDKVRVYIDIDGVTQLNISVGQLIHTQLGYSWPYGEQTYWSDIVYPHILKVESFDLATKMSNGQTVGYVYTILTRCEDVANSNSISSPNATLTNFRIENSVYKADFEVSATVSDSKYQADPTMLFFIEYQSPGCNEWRSVFNALSPNATPARGKPKTFTQSYTFAFANSSNCRVATNDGLLGVPYGGKVRVKAIHEALILFSNEIQLPISVGTLNGTYLINGVSNAPLTVARGQTYKLNVDAIGHPFLIKTDLSTGTANTYNNGITNNGAQDGVITWVVDNNAPSTLYYNCQFHSSMRGTINVV